VGDVVVDQRVVSGIGNIYKSEGLLLAGIHPRTPAGVVPRTQLREFFNKLIPLMEAGRVHYGATITLPEAMRTDRTARNWVYRRRGKPCLVCATPIEMFRQGELKRTTYACPRCQKERAGPSRAAAR
jgi:endonuclease-8